MKKPDTESIHDSIKHLMETDYNYTCEYIKSPSVPGAGKNVYIAGDNNGDEFVFKLLPYSLAHKNVTVSKLVGNNIVQTPNNRLLGHNGYTFESYPIIPGNTMYEMIRAGKMTDTQIHATYRQLMAIQYQMSCLPTDRIKTVPNIKCHQIAAQNTATSNGKLSGTIIRAVVRTLNGAPGGHGLYHFDLTPKNVIINQGHNIVAIIDMDSVGICDKNFAIAMMVAKYAQMGYQISELLDYYQDLSHQSLQRGRINRMVELTNMGKTLLWRHANRHKQR